MIFKNISIGDTVLLPDDTEMIITSGPQESNLLGNIYVEGTTKDGSHSTYFATENTEVIVL